MSKKGARLKLEVCKARAPGVFNCTHLNIEDLNLGSEK